MLAFALFNMVWIAFATCYLATRPYPLGPVLWIAYALLAFPLYILSLALFASNM